MPRAGAAGAAHPWPSKEKEEEGEGEVAPSLSDVLENQEERGEGVAEGDLCRGRAEGGEGGVATSLARDAEGEEEGAGVASLEMPAGQGCSLAVGPMDLGVGEEAGEVGPLSLLRAKEGMPHPYLSLPEQAGQVASLSLFAWR